MAEYIRSVRVTVEVDTNKRTIGINEFTSSLENAVAVVEDFVERFEL